ncbi:MAG: T9SS type A sorting domain-containing protein [Bacteroidota bacterium]
MKFIQTLIIFFLSTSIFFAQGWKRTTGGSADDPCKAIVQMEDDGYILIGDSESFGDDGDRDVYVVRYDLNGNPQWTKFYDDAFVEFANDALVTPKGEIIIAGSIRENPSVKNNAYLLKINAFGDFKWSQSFGGEGEESISSVTLANDGGYVMVGHTTSFGAGGEDMFIVKTDASGNEIWKKNYGSEIDERANAVVAVEDGYVMTGYLENSSVDRDIYVIKVNEQGGLVWSRTYGSRFRFEEANDIAVTSEGDLLIGGNKGTVGPFYLLKTNSQGIEIWDNTYENEFLEARFSRLTIVDDNSIALAGFNSITADNSDIYVINVDRQGRKVWENHFGDEERIEIGYDIIKTNDGGLAIIGGSSVFTDIIGNDFLPLDDFVLIKTDARGNINSNRIEGRVFYDRDENGTFSEGDLPLKDWPIRLTQNIGGEEDEVSYVISDENGNYDVTVGTGRYVTSVLNQNENYWTLSTNNIANFFSTTYDTVSMVDFPVTADILCPYVEVGVSAPSLSICNDINYTISYCNIGTSQSGEFYVYVEFDEALTVNDAALPFTDQGDNVYRFDLSGLDIGECGEFAVNTSMACEGYVVGEAHQVRASVQESLACLEPDPDWDMSSLVVEGKCEDDTGDAQFTVTNNGTGNMGRPSRIHVIQEDIISFSAPIRLDVNVDTLLNQKAEGKTTRIIVEQSEGHPGRSFPTIAVEGCGEGEGNATVRTGFVTIFPEDDADPFVAIDVQENLENATGTMMRAQPKGYREERFIEVGRDIVYHIQFQNLESDPLRHVVIRDTLPEELDIASVVVEGSSHAYDFEIYENRILRFTLDKLSLPSINEDAAGSKGFIKYRVRQMPNLPAGTVIEHHALVSLNFSKPFLTNPVKHTIGGKLFDFVELGEFVPTDNPKVEGVTVNVGPNPFVETTLFTIEGWDGKVPTIHVYDATGRLLQQQQFQNSKLLFNKAQLSAGVYFYQIEADGVLLSDGKLLIQ